MSKKYLGQKTKKKKIKTSGQTSINTSQQTNKKKNIKKHAYTFPHLGCKIDQHKHCGILPSSSSMQMRLNSTDIPVPSLHPSLQLSVIP